MRGERIIEYGKERLNVQESEARDLMKRSGGDLNNYVLTISASGYVIDGLNGN